MSFWRKRKMGIKLPVFPAIVESERSMSLEAATQLMFELLGQNGVCMTDASINFYWSKDGYQGRILDNQAPPQSLVEIVPKDQLGYPTEHCCTYKLLNLRIPPREFTKAVLGFAARDM
jgi:hypothetical protein